MLNFHRIRASARFVFIGASIAVLAACATKEPPPPPPPPPQPISVPMKPYPPNGATANLYIPPLASDGLFKSVNRGISAAQTVWNLRSAYNVGALNCTKPEHAAILPGYKDFLKNHAKTLASVNAQVDKEFKKEYGSTYIKKRETYMTEVYNHYALPPTLVDFCDAVLALSRDAAIVKSADLEEFSNRSLPNVEIVFDDFYRRYQKYQVDLQAWEDQYGHYYTSSASAAAPSAANP